MKIETRGNKKGNPNGAGRKPRSVAAERTSISIEVELKKAAIKNRRNITSDVNMGLRNLYKEKEFLS